MAYQPKSYKKFVATAATATLVATAVAPAALADEATTAAFTDVPASYADAIDFVVGNSIAKGLDENTFGIPAQIKRGDVAIMIANAAGLNDKDAPAAGFTDVPTRGALAVNSLAAAGVVNGKSATNFGFQDSITRGEAAQMLANAFELTGGNVEDIPFTDVGDKHRFSEAVAALVANEVTSGETPTSFGVGNPIKRGDFAKFLYALEDLIVIEEPEHPGTPDPEVPGGEITEGLEISFADSTLAADGKDNTVVTFTITGEDGEVDTDADDIVLGLQTTHGSFASERVTVQDGVATVVLTSEQVNEDTQGRVTATVVEASEDHKELIGQIFATAFFNLEVSDGSSEVLNITGAESNQADRVVLHFDRAVELEDFVQTTPAEGDILYYVRDEDGVWSDEATTDVEDYDAEDVRHALIEGTETDALTITQDSVEFEIQGLKPVEGDANAIEVILSTEDGVLDNNDSVTVASNYVSDFGRVSDSSTSFTLTDARDPEVTDAWNEGMREVTVEFSESVVGANFQVDALPLSDEDDVDFGEFDVRTLEDNRNLATISLDEYLTAGQHKVEVSSATDFAGNVAATQNFDFTVAANTTTPTADVTVASPEQFHINFNVPVAGNVEGFEFQVYDGENDSWETVEDPALTAELLDGEQELVVELTEDWTQIYNTEETGVNYYNNEYRIVFNADTLTNTDNGLMNDRFVVELSESGSALNSPDVTSPTIESISQVNLSDRFLVTANEPVKIAGLNGDAGDTLNQEQDDTGSLPNVNVQFIGTDADGETVTIDGSVVEFLDEDDTAFYVTADEDLQAGVDAGDYGLDWQVVIRQLTDDVGNTAATLTENFTMAETVVNPLDTPFAIESTVATYAPLWDGSAVIRVNYTESVQTNGEYDATDVQNYTLNGRSLPTGTSIAISDWDDAEGDDNDSVIITLPADAVDFANNVINVNRSLVSEDGSVLVGSNEVVFNAGINAPSRAVQYLINNLPDAELVTLATEDDIEEARDEYEELSTAQRSLVDIARLVAAENALADLVAEEEEVEEAAIAAVETAVSVLEDTDFTTASTGDLLNAEEALYDARVAVGDLNTDFEIDVTDYNSRLDTVEAAIDARAVELATVDVEAAIGDLDLAAEVVIPELTFEDATAEEIQAVADAINDLPEGIEITADLLASIPVADADAGLTQADLEAVLVLALETPSNVPAGYSSLVTALQVALDIDAE